MFLQKTHSIKTITQLQIVMLILSFTILTFEFTKIYLCKHHSDFWNDDFIV
jgi:hypothetical protein